MRRPPTFVCFIVSLLTVSLATFDIHTLYGQRYRNSIVSTDFDIITVDDPSCFESLRFLGKRQEEMPDKSNQSNELFKDAFVFRADYSDGTWIEMALDAAFGTHDRAEAEARRYTDRLGRLPTRLRAGVRRLVIHRGGERSTAFSDIGLIVVYSANATKRIETNDLEETLFHESVHASWDKMYARSQEWKRAQMSDQGFATAYGESKPELEDLAESSLLAFAVLHHPDRLPAEDLSYLKKQIPNRIMFVESLLPIGQPLFDSVQDSDRTP